jgi:uncharacterized membrane protein YkvA (DUF1232 family)
MRPPESMPTSGDQGSEPGEIAVGLEQTTFDEADTSRFARDEARVRHGFWRKLRQFAAHLPFVEDLLAAYYCAFDRQTPLQVKMALMGALAYFVLPFDFVPDFLLVVGFADDAAVLAAAIRLVAVHIKPEHREAAARALRDGAFQDQA